MDYVADHVYLHNPAWRAKSIVLVQPREMTSKHKFLDLDVYLITLSTKL
jgi:hypothetical protein